jgi:hypothetical protein
MDWVLTLRNIASTQFGALSLIKCFFLKTPPIQLSGGRLLGALLFFGALHLPKAHSEVQNQGLQTVRDAWSTLMPAFVGSNSLSDLEVLNGNPIQIRFNLSRLGDRKTFRVVCQHDGVRADEINIVSTSRRCSVFEIGARDQLRALSRREAQSALGNPFFLTGEDIFYRVLSSSSTRVRSGQGAEDTKCASGPTCSRLVQFLNQLSASSTQLGPQPTAPPRRLVSGVVSPKITWRCPRGAAASRDLCDSVPDRYLANCRHQGLPRQQVACVPSREGNHWFCSWDASRCYFTNQAHCLEGDILLPAPRHRDYHFTGQQTPQGVLAEDAVGLCLKGASPVSARP